MRKLPRVTSSLVLMTPSEVGSALRIGLRNVYRCSEKNLSHFRLGNQLRFKVEDVINFKRQREHFGEKKARRGF